MTLILIATATFLATLTGGLFALYLKDRRHLILGFSAGAVIGVAFFDVLPEALDLSENTFSHTTITSFVALGFVFYMIFDRFLGFHVQTNHHHDHTDKSIAQGNLGAGSLSLHSFFDGLAIGLAFQVSSAVGAVVATAVLVHDFSDGINTVNYVLKSNDQQKLALRWLLVDALAPVLGIITTLFFTLAETTLGLILALFTGFFLYIGASDLLPESQHNHPQVLTTIMTVVGIITMFIAIRLAGL